MMSSNTKKLLSSLFAIGAAIVCFVMMIVGMINKVIPSFAWVTFSMFLFAYVIAAKNHEEAEI